MSRPPRLWKEWQVALQSRYGLRFAGAGSGRIVQRSFEVCELGAEVFLLRLSHFAQEIGVGIGDRQDLEIRRLAAAVVLKVGGERILNRVPKKYKGVVVVGSGFRFQEIVEERHQRDGGRLLRTVDIGIGRGVGLIPPFFEDLSGFMDLQ